MICGNPSRSRTGAAFAICSWVKSTPTARADGRRARLRRRRRFPIRSLRQPLGADHLSSSCAVVLGLIGPPRPDGDLVFLLSAGAGIEQRSPDREYASLGDPELPQLSWGWCRANVAEVHPVERGRGVGDQPDERWRQQMPRPERQPHHPVTCESLLQPSGQLPRSFEFGNQLTRLAQRRFRVLLRNRWAGRAPVW